MDATPKKGGRFQFHLSTAIIVMLTAGLLLGINMEVQQLVNAELLQDHRHTLAPAPPSPRVHVRTFINSRSEPGFGAYLPYLSVMILLAVAAACEWWIRRRECQPPRPDPSAPSPHASTVRRVPEPPG